MDAHDIGPQSRSTRCKKTDHLVYTAFVYTCDAADVPLLEVARVPGSDSGSHPVVPSSDIGCTLDVQTQDLVCESVYYVERWSLMLLFAEKVITSKVMARREILGLLLAGIYSGCMGIKSAFHLRL